MERAPGRAYRKAALAFVVLLCGAGAFAGWYASGNSQAASPACKSQVLRGVLPVWARAGFSESKPRMSHVLSASGKLTAILWADPLLSPRPEDHNNKILWVARVADSSGSDMRISAQRMIGSTPIGSPVARTVTGGPGPSIINMPTAGCWRFNLSWAGQHDSVDLEYAPNH